MKKILCAFFIVLLIFSGTMAVAGQWIGCDPAPENADTDPGNDVIAVVVRKDGVETEKAYAVDPAKNKVRLVDIVSTDSGLYEFAFKNSQGRTSTFVSFDLSAPPNGCEGVGIYTD